MATSIVRDATEASLGQKEHLIFERIGAQRPTVAENDGLSCAPVVVINVRSVFGRDCAHDISSVL